VLLALTRLSVGQTLIRIVLNGNKFYVSITTIKCWSNSRKNSVCFSICVVLELVDELFSVWYECKS